MKFCSILVYFLRIESDIRGLEHFNYLADTTDNRRPSLLTRTTGTGRDELQVVVLLTMTHHTNHLKGEKIYFESLH